MDLYKLHSTPESLDFYADADSAVVELFWPKFEGNLDQLKKREGAIATDPKYSYWYARLIKGRFKLGEAAIIKSPKYAGLYAQVIFLAKSVFLKAKMQLPQRLIQLSLMRCSLLRDHGPKASQQLQSPHSTHTDMQRRC